MQIGLMSESDKLEFTSRAGSQVVRKICVVVFALPRRGDAAEMAVIELV